MAAGAKYDLEVLDTRSNNNNSLLNEIHEDSLVIDEQKLVDNKVFDTNCKPNTVNLLHKSQIASRRANLRTMRQRRYSWLASLLELRLQPVSMLH